MASRRTTLGPISQSALNSRMSMGRPSMGMPPPIGKTSSRISMGPGEHHPQPSKPMATHSRMSMGGGIAATGRRSSVGGLEAREAGRMSSTGARIITDPRNIGDKSFMHNSIKTLIQYLSDHGYDHPLAIKILTRPSVKDFSNIINFLFHQIDPNFSSTGKLEDDVVAWFKILGYPFQITKSHFTAVISPHAWPSLLACIMWLIELLQYDEAAAIGSYIDNPGSMDDEVETDDPVATMKSFHRYVCQAYKLFLTGEDSQCAHLEEQYKSSFENTNMFIKDDISFLENSIRQLENEINEYEKQRAYIPELETNKKKLSSDLTKYEQMVDTYMSHKEQLIQKIETRKKCLSEINESIKILQHDNETLKHRVANQELSAEDVRNMVAERERLEDAQRSASETRQLLLRKVWEAETSLRDKVQGLQDSARTYNAIAESLKLIPATAKNAHGQNLAIEVDIKTKKGLLKGDVKNDLVPCIKDFTVEVKNLIKETRTTLTANQEMFEDLEMKYNEIAGKQSTLEAKLRLATDSYRHAVEGMESSKELHRQEMDALEPKLIKARDTSSDESRYAMAMRQIAEHRTMLDNKRQEYDRERKELIDAILETVTAAANHRELAQKFIDDVKSQYTTYLEQFFSKVSSVNPMLATSKKSGVPLYGNTLSMPVMLSPINPQEEMYDSSMYSKQVDHMDIDDGNVAPQSQYRPNGMRNMQSEWKQPKSHEYPFTQTRRPVYNLTGLINECARSDHNLLDESIQMDFRDG